MNTNWERNSSVHLQIVLQKAVKIINSKIGKDFKEKGITTHSSVYLMSFILKEK